jgi:hypothetical protein
MAEVLNAIYEADFLGFSYGFRPARSAHKALTALERALMTRDVNWVLDIDIRNFLDVVSYCPQGYQLCYPRLSVYPIPLFTMTNMRPSMVHSATT